VRLNNKQKGRRVSLWVSGQICWKLSYEGVWVGGRAVSVQPSSDRWASWWEGVQRRRTFERTINCPTWK